MTDVEEKRVVKMIRGGSIFLFTINSDCKPKPHYFVVLNYSPKFDKVIILVRGATHSEAFYNRRDYLSEEEMRQTMIDVLPKDFPKFNRPTCFDCNEAHSVSIRMLADKLYSKDLKYIGYFEDSILNKLRDGFMSSRHVEKKHIYMLDKKKKRLKNKKT